MGNCEKQTRIGFLKTHKCASSSVQNILMRFGQANKLNFALPTVGNYLGRYVSYSRAMLANTPWERAGLEYQARNTDIVLNTYATRRNLFMIILSVGSALLC